MPCVLLRHPQGNVLFDTGCHPSVAQNAEARWGSIAKLMVPIMQPGDNVIAGLAGIGLAPDDIDVVVCSHLHPDHCGCNAFFRNATFMIHARELEAARTPEAEALGYLAAEWDQPIGRSIRSRASAICSATDASCSSPCPATRPARPARSWRSTAAAPICSPPIPSACARRWISGIVPRNTWNADALVRSLAEVKRIEQRGATVICGHDAAQWASLRKGADAYD